MRRLDACLEVIEYEALSCSTSRKCTSVLADVKDRKSQLLAVRAQIAAAAAKAPGTSVHLVSLCAGDGRDVIGTFAAADARQDMHATLIEAHPALVTRGQAAVEQLGLTRRITFRCADATHSSTYVDLRPAQILVLSGIFGNLTARDVQRLIAVLPSLCARD